MRIARGSRGDAAAQSETPSCMPGTHDKSMHLEPRQLVTDLLNPLTRTHHTEPWVCCMVTPARDGVGRRGLWHVGERVNSDY